MFLTIICRIVIVGLSTVFVYDFPSLEKIDEYSTFENNYGLLDLHPKAMAILGGEEGSLRVIVHNLLYVNA